MTPSRALSLPLAALALAASSVPAAAGGPCDGAVTQLDLNRCSHAEWDAADRELNRAYRAAVEAARGFDSWPEGRAEETLRAAQRVRVGFRDAACEAEAALWDGGSAEPMIRSGCLTQPTLQRTDDLWSYAER